MASGINIGLTLGQHRNPPALSVVEGEFRDLDAQRRTMHFTVRSLEQLEAKISYPAIAERLCQVISALKAKNPVWHARVYIDTTGLGAPVMDLLRESVRRDARLAQVSFNHGDQRVEGDSALDIRLGKAFLVTRVQTLLQTRRLHLPRTPQNEQLAQELLDYQLDFKDNANETYGAFQVGSRDQLVTALGLAVNKNVVVCHPPSPMSDLKPRPKSPIEKIREVHERFSRSGLYGPYSDW